MPETVIDPAETVEPAGNSRKREVTAVLVSGLLAVALGLITSGLIGKLRETVHDSIAPPAKDAEEV